MTHANHSRAERAALCDLFEQLGPDAATLCEGWTTRDLAAHLVVREARPDAGLGLIAPPFATHGENVRRSYATKPWADLVARVRNGPPRTSVMRIGPVDRLVNTLEYFVHHEDVRRAQPGWEPRELDPGLASDLTAILGRMGKLFARRSPAGITTLADARTPTVIKAGDPMVTVSGPAGEIVMFLEGRQQASRVDLDGPTGAVEAVRSASFGV